MTQYRDDMFSEDQIAQAIGELSEYYTMRVIATLAAGAYTPAVIRAFTALADSLGLAVDMDGSGMTLRTEQGYRYQRDQALSNLRYAAERGEITPAAMEPAGSEGTTEA